MADSIFRSLSSGARFNSFNKSKKQKSIGDPPDQTSLPPSRSHHSSSSFSSSHQVPIQNPVGSEPISPIKTWESHSKNNFDPDTSEIKRTSKHSTKSTSNILKDLKIKVDGNNLPYDPKYYDIDSATNKVVLLDREAIHLRSMDDYKETMADSKQRKSKSGIVATNKTHTVSTTFSKEFDAWSHLRLEDELMRVIKQKMKWDSPTPIQEMTIPAMEAGRELQVQSPTGSGKTGSFLLPIINQLIKTMKKGNFNRPINDSSYSGSIGVQNLIVAPTSELANQIYLQALILTSSLIDESTISDDSTKIPKIHVLYLNKQSSLILKRKTNSNLGKCSSSTFKDGKSESSDNDSHDIIDHVRSVDVSGKSDHEDEQQSEYDFQLSPAYFNILSSLTNPSPSSNFNNHHHYTISRPSDIHLMIATPAILINHCKFQYESNAPFSPSRPTSIFDFSKLNWLVLDEVDRLMTQDFLRQVDEILTLLKSNQQHSNKKATIKKQKDSKNHESDHEKSNHENHYKLAFFSATLMSQVEMMTKSVLSDPLRIRVGIKNTAAFHVDQYLKYVGSEEGKFLALKQILSGQFSYETSSKIGSSKSDNNNSNIDSHIHSNNNNHSRSLGSRISNTSAAIPSAPILIFVQTKSRSSQLLYNLEKETGISVDYVTSERSDHQIRTALKNFRSGNTSALVTTDLLARGLDFKAVSTVINYDMPTNVTTYIHRVGRTGRAGGVVGKAFTLITDADLPHLNPILNILIQSQQQNNIPQWILSKYEANEPLALQLQTSSYPNSRTNHHHRKQQSEIKIQREDIVHVHTTPKRYTNPRKEPNNNNNNHHQGRKLSKKRKRQYHGSDEESNEHQRMKKKKKRHDDDDDDDDDHEEESNEHQRMKKKKKRHDHGTDE